MEILLHKVCGRPASRTMTLRAAGPEDAAAFYALQNEVRAAMPHPEQFVPDTLENIARYLKEDLCIGGWDGGRLGAYFILRYCGQDAHNYAAFMGIPREEWDAGPTPTAPSSTPTTGQRSAAEAAGSGACPAPSRHRGHRGHRQPGKSVQPQQRSGQRL